MKNSYFKAGDHAIAVNFKVGSATLARAIIRDFQPETEAMLHNTSGDGRGVAYPEGRGPDNNLWHGLAVKVDPAPVVVAHLLVRDPIEKFRSACQMSKVKDVDAKLAQIETDGFGRDSHFWPQSRFTNTDLKLYKFPHHLDALAQAVGLSLPLPEVNMSGSIITGDKPTLTPEQEARVLAIYADDIALYNSITEAGQTYTAPTPAPTPEEVRAVAIKSAYDAAADAFDALPKGKQALWEPVRAAVADAIRQGDFTGAREILETTPAVYPGAEDDRDAFLELFPAD